MHDSFKKALPELNALCRKHSVARLDVFGSAASGDFDPETSDYDFVVEFEPLRAGTRADTYFALLEDLQALLGRPVDLVMNKTITNPFLEQSISASRQALYAAGKMGTDHV